MSSPSTETKFPKHLAILPEPRPINVLHVDDEPDFADLTSIYLERVSDEIEVITADSVEVGLERLETDVIDCIVSDYDMPHRNGLDFLAIVREEYPELPFILFTGKGNEEIASEAISAGVTDYLQKKTGTDQYTVLANRIQNAASQYKTKREIERMGIALKTVDAGIAFLNEDGQLIYVNPAYAEMFGYAPEELTGHPIDMIYPNELVNQVYEDILPIVPREGEWSGESIHIHKDGTRLIVSQKFSYCSARMLLCFILSVTKQNGTDRQLEGVKQTQTDITEQTERDLRLSESSHRLNLALEATDTGVWEWIMETDEVVWSETLEQQVGIEPGSFGGTFEAFEEFLHPDDAAEVHRAIEQAIQGDGAYNVEFRMIREDGEHIWVRALAEHFSEDGIERLIGTTIDITEQKARDQQLEREHDRFRAVFEGATDAIVIADDDGRYLDANPQAGELFGLDREDLIGRSIAEFAHDDYDFETAWEQFQQSERERGTFPLVRADGDQRTVEYASSTEIVDGQHLSILRDVTERSEREEQLQQRTARLEALYDNSPDMIDVLDTDGRLLDVNSRFCQELGYTEEELLGRPIWEIDVQVTEDNVRTLLADFELNERRKFEGAYERKDGSTFPVEVHLLRLNIVGGDRFLAISRDITGRKAYEASMERQNERLEEFAGIVSHDLRNPLTVAEGRLELAREDCTSDHLDAVDGALNRMETLIENMLELARLGQEVSVMESVDLDELGRACWQSVDTGDASLVTMDAPTIQGDRSRVQQLLENLIRNAVEHGGEEVTITIGEIDEGFYVEDDGVGIPEDDLDEIFESGYSTSEEGTGFGLSIVKQIADAHGWTVEPSIGADGGARFEFSGVRPV